MHRYKTLKPVAVSTLLAAASIAGLPNMAAADVSASVGVANLYLFRGANLSSSSPQVHGALDYSHPSGFYTGVWGSSEGSTGQEYDLYLGFAGESGGFTYDINVTAYEYPQVGAAVGNKLGDTREIGVTLGAAGFALQLVEGRDFSGTADKDLSYYSLSYGMGKFGILLGMNDVTDNTTTPNGESDNTHLDLSFSATDELKFTLSTIIDEDTGAGTGRAKDPASDTLFVVNWDKSFDL